MGSIQDLPSWCVAPTVAQCVQLVQCYKEVIEVRYVNREALKDSHKLAYWARRTKQPMITISDMQNHTHHDL